MLNVVDHDAHVVFNAPEDMRLLELCGTRGLGFAGLDLDRRATADVEHFKPGGSYWKRLKDQFVRFVCAERDPNGQYAAQRAELEGSGKITLSAVAGAMGGYLATTVGLAAGLLTPFIALLLLAMVSIGRDAFCLEDKPVDKLDKVRLRVVVPGPTPSSPSSEGVVRAHAESVAGRADESVRSATPDDTATQEEAEEDVSLVPSKFNRVT